MGHRKQCSQFGKQLLASPPARRSHLSWHRKLLQPCWHPEEVPALPPPGTGLLQAQAQALTLGCRASPLRQFMSIWCCLRKASFQGLYMKPGLSSRRLRRLRGSSMPAGTQKARVRERGGRQRGGSRGTRSWARPHPRHGTSPARAGCPLPKPASHGTSGRPEASRGAPGKRGRGAPAVKRGGQESGAAGLCTALHPPPRLTHATSQGGREVRPQGAHWLTISFPPLQPSTPGFSAMPASAGSLPPLPLPLFPKPPPVHAQRHQPSTRRAMEQQQPLMPSQEATLGNQDAGRREWPVGPIRAPLSLRPACPGAPRGHLAWPLLSCQQGPYHVCAPPFNAADSSWHLPFPLEPPPAPCLAHPPLALPSNPPHSLNHLLEPQPGSGLCPSRSVLARSISSRQMSGRPHRHPSRPLTSLGRSEMKSRWNWGSITCIMCLIWGGSQRSMSSSRASSFSGPLQRCREKRRGSGPHVLFTHYTKLAPACSTL